MLKIVLLLGAAVALGPEVFAQPAQIDEKTAVQIEALSRLKGVDLESNASLKAAVLRVLEKTRGTPHFVEIVRDFNLKGQTTALLEYATKFPAETSGIDAFQLVIAENGTNSLPSWLDSKDAVAIVQLLGNTKDAGLQETVRSLVQDSSIPLPTRTAAVQALAHTEPGAKYLLDLARDEKLPTDLKLSASSELNLAPWPEVKKAALEILPLPQTKNAETLPPISELLKRQGDIRRGSEIFESQIAACSSCHLVHGKGKDIGPQLSEIGTKLGKDALYQSILDPSSGISFGYDAWNIILKNDDELFGLITSETADEITVKAQTGVITKAKKLDITQRQKLTTSLMPIGLQMTMSTQELVDLVEFLASLKKPDTAQ